MVNKPNAGSIAMLVAGYSATNTATLGEILKAGTPALTGTSVLINTAGQTIIGI